MTHGSKVQPRGQTELHYRDKAQLLRPPQLSATCRVAELIELTTVIPVGVHWTPGFHLLLTRSDCQVVTTVHWSQSLSAATSVKAAYNLFSF